MDLGPNQIASLNESNAKINIWEGAVRAGKTYVSLWRFLKEVKFGPPGHFVMISKSVGTFKRNIYDQLYQMIGSDAHYYPGLQKLMIWGRTIHVIGAHDERAASVIKGATFMGAYVDEATEIPESSWNMLVSRCAMGGAKIFATTNPDTPFHYLKTNFLTGNPDVKSWKFFMEDNPALTADERAYLSRQYKGLWYRRYIQAEWCLAEGSVYDFFDSNIHTRQSPPTYAKHFFVGIDYGTTNPCAFVLVGFNDEVSPSLWVEKEYYFDSRKEGFQKTDAEYASDLIDFIEGYPIKEIFSDPSAASFKLELRRRGLVPPLRDANNDVENGIRAISTHLAMGDLVILKDCHNLIKEFQSYVWDSKKAERGIEEPIKANDHALDALRYIIYTKFGNKKSLRETTQEQREFELWQKQQRKNSPWAPPRPQASRVNWVTRK